jgi:hypothetical protein
MKGLMTTSEYFNRCALHPFYWYQDFCANYNAGVYTSYAVSCDFC